MKKFVNLLIVVVLVGFVLDKAAESAKAYFEIRSVQTKVKKKFAFIEVKYKCNLKKAKNVELKVYAFHKKGGVEKVTSGKFIVNEVEKGTDKELFMIGAGYVKEYGSPRKIRVEIWYKDKLRASKTKPGAKKKWWKKDTMNVIVRTDIELQRLLRDD